MKKSLTILFIAFFIVIAQNIFAQLTPSPDTPFLLPQTVFVGDTGRLVVPLGNEYMHIEPFVLDAMEYYDELHILRIELERRANINRLLIDFIPYSPGLLIFPPLEISPENDLVIEDLEVEIASILNPARMSLAETAAPLAQPGTGLLVYGSISIILLVLFLGIAGTVLGRRHFGDIFLKIRKRYLLRKMISFLRRLGLDCSNREENEVHSYLGLLSGEFREFLSLFTGINCLSLSAGEFLEFSSEEIPMQHELYSIFRKWDILRFSGQVIEASHVLDAVREAGKIVFALYKAEKEKPIFAFKTDRNKEQAKTLNEAMAGESL